MTGTDILTEHVHVSEQASNCRVGNETVILHAGNGTIWHLLQEGLSPAQSCARIAEDFGVPLAQVEDDARKFLDDLKRHDIIRSS
jgi:hypothetical protein